MKSHHLPQAFNKTQFLIFILLKNRVPDSALIHTKTTSMRKCLILFPILLFFVMVRCNNNTPQEKPASRLVNLLYQDKGDFKLLYQLFLGNNSNAKIVIDKLRNDGVITEMVNELNGLFKLPHDVIIRFRYSDTANAWYNPNTRSIDFTSAFIINFYQNFAKYYTGRQLVDKVTNVVIFFLFHEVGHALTDIYQLSVKGPEEDMADYFSIYLLSTGNDIVKQAALDGADMFYEYSRSMENMPAGSLPLWDVHSLDKKRFYNICCLMYGSDPVKYSYFINRKLVHPDAAGSCQYEFQRVITSWHKDLSFYMHAPVKQ